jgi:plastocyanin
LTAHRRLAPFVVLTLAGALAGCGSAAAPSASPTTEDHALHSPSAAAPSASAGESDDTPPADATRMEDGDTIVMSQFSFSETAVVVPVGTTLTFSNEDNVFHTVTNGVQGFAHEDAAFDDPVDAGESIEIAFDEPGRYDITCEPHPIMQMTVFVEA